MKKSAVNEDNWPLLYEDGPYLDYKEYFNHPFFSFKMIKQYSEIKLKIEQEVFRAELELWFEAGGFKTIPIDEVKTEIGVYSHIDNSPRNGVKEYYFSVKFGAFAGHFDYFTLLNKDLEPYDPCRWELGEDRQFMFSTKDAEGEIRNVSVGTPKTFPVPEHLTASFDSAWPRNHV